MSFFAELQRRNVFRVGAAYAVVAWLVLQVADLVLENIGAPAWIMQAIMLVIAVGFPLALVFAWAFELTPTGLKRDADVDRSQSIAPQTGKRLDKVIIALLVGVVLVMAVERIWFAGTDAGDEATAGTVDKSIAVLPFIDLSQDQDQALFAKGLAEEILNALMRTPDLLVASRTSAFKYIGSDQDIREIAAELGVAHIVEGSVRRSGDSVRVTAQLIRASDGFHLWSQNYDREMSDVIAIQEDLAISIARALETSMDPAALQAMMAAGTRSVEAYEHYLSGLALDHEYFVSGGPQLLRDSYAEFERARTADPQFASAHARAAGFWEDQLQVTSRLSRATNNPPRYNLEQFEARINAAIETAPNEVMRWQYQSELAAIRMELRKQLRLLKKVVAARPTYVDGWSNLLGLAVGMADYELGGESAEQLMAIYHDRPEPGIAIRAMLALQRMERHEENVLFVRQVLADFPDSVGVAYQAHRALLWAGEVGAAAELMPVLTADVPESYAIAQLRQACAEGRIDDAERITSAHLDSLEDPDSENASWHFHMLLGDVAAANNVIRQTTSPDILYPRASWMFYRQFDPAPFPELVALLERERVTRKPLLKVPFACR